MQLLKFNKFVKQITIITIGILIVVLFIFDFKEINPQERQQKLDLKREFFGIVTDKKIDKSQHNWPLVILNSSHKQYLPLKLYNQISIGDSIIKKSSSLKIDIYKNQKFHKSIQYLE